MKSVLKNLSSLRFTVVLLLFSLMLVFAGTLAQVKLGIFRTQEIYFESFFIYANVSGFQIPVLPAGYTIGGLLVVNLLAAFITRFRLKSKHVGLLIVHSGLILILLGEVMTDHLQKDSQLRFAEGESKNFTERIFDYEFAVVEHLAETSRVVAFSSKGTQSGDFFSNERSPLSLEVVSYWPNSMLQANEGASAIADSGMAVDLAVLPLPLTGKLDERNVPSALVDVSADGLLLGRYLLSGHIAKADSVELADGTQMSIALRLERDYLGYSMKLDDFIHEVFPGTSKPSHFESKVTLQGGDIAVPRASRIYMNHPLRHDGKTFYQASFGGNGTISVLQVVENPSWLMPYISCGLVGLGLLWQTLTRLRQTRVKKGAVA